jgi:hypothetical protein
MDIRRIWVAQFHCPQCDREHYLESEAPIDVIEPERLGLGALCGSCEAQRRCWIVGDGDTRPFWSEADEARAWGNLRRNPDKYCMQSWETDEHDRPLRDDRLEKMLALIGVPPAGKGYPIRYKMRWTIDEMRAKGIDWPIPPSQKPF